MCVSAYLHEFGEVVVVLEMGLEVGDSTVRVPVATDVGPLEERQTRDG